MIELVASAAELPSHFPRKGFGFEPRQRRGHLSDPLSGDCFDCLFDPWGGGAVGLAVGGLGTRIIASAGTQNFERSEFIGHQQLEPFEPNKSEPLRDLTSAQSHQRSEAMSAFS